MRPAAEVCEDPAQVQRPRKLGARLLVDRERRRAGIDQLLHERGDLGLRHEHQEIDVVGQPWRREEIRAIAPP